MKEDAMPERPWTVTTAYYLLWLSLFLIPVIDALWHWPKVLTLEVVMHDSMLLGILALFTGVWLTMVLVVYQIGRGRNWARIIFLILTLVSTPPRLSGIIHASGRSAFQDTIFNIYQLEIFIVAVVLLFQRSSSDWFKAVKKLRSKDESPEAT